MVGVLVFPWFILLLAGVGVRFYWAADWPGNDDLQRSWWVGWAIVTALTLAAVAVHSQFIRLLSDSIANDRSVWRMTAASACCLWITLAVGLQVGQAYDFWRRKLVGCLDVHGYADLAYLADVTAQLSRLSNATEQLDGEQQRIVRRLMQDLTTWTSLKVVHSDDVHVQELALQALACDIYPCGRKRPMVEDYLAKEAALLEQELGVTRDALKRVQRESQAIALKLEILHSQDSSTLTRAETKQQSGNLAAELTQLENELQLQQVKERRLLGRRQLREELRSISVGLNVDYPWLRLPVSLPGGMWWSLSYLVLLIASLVYVFAGLLIMLCWHCASTIEKLRRLSFLRAYWSVGALASLVAKLLLGFP